MTGSANKNKYDLEERTYKYADTVRQLMKKVPWSMANHEDGKQLIRASGSVAANYIEANNSLSKKEFVYRIKLCRKESKESILFLRLLDIKKATDLDNLRDFLV